MRVRCVRSNVCIGLDADLIFYTGADWQARRRLVARLSFIV